MNKELYLSQLKQRLKSLPKEEAEAALYYASEYFLEAGVGQEEKVMDELGTPERFAAQIMAEYTLKSIDNQHQPTSPKKSMRNMVLLILGIVSLPFSLPVVLCLLIAVFVISILFVVMTFVLVILIGVGGFVGLSMLVQGITSLFTNPPVGLVSTGTALLLLGLVLILLAIAYGLMAKLLPFCVKGLGNLFRKAKGEERYEI